MFKIRDEFFQHLIDVLKRFSSVTAYEGEPNNAVMRMACEMNCYSGTAENEVENCIQNKCYRQSPQEYNKGFVSF